MYIQPLYYPNEAVTVVGNWSLTVKWIVSAGIEDSFVICKLFDLSRIQESQIIESILQRTHDHTIDETNLFSSLALGTAF